MGIVIFDGNTKSYSIVNENKKEYVEIIKLPQKNENIENNDNGQTIIKRPKTYKKKNKLSKENQEFLNGIISGSGFKIISKQ